MRLDDELSALIDLVDEIDERAGALNDGSSADAGALAGATGQAAENRAIRRAHASLARERARRMREGLELIRTRVRRSADLVRELEGGTPSRLRAGSRGIGATAQALADAEEPAEVVAAVRAAADDAIGGVGWIGICVRDAAGTVTVEEPADPVVADLLAVEVAEDGGPMLTALDTADTVRVADVAADPRWEGWAAAADAVGVRAVVAHGFRGRRLPHGAALVVLLGAGVALDPTVSARIEVLADQTAVALAASRRQDALREALESRDMIGQAKGILVEQGGIDADEAFQRLIEASQHSNLKLREVARWLVDERRSRDRSQ